ncbi:MAG TPA: PEP-CTERM sorting domain-containing protein [Candidatus Limnocylindria bacterium]|nr:PEP-CTERM sorting domain-containing protein [Candidatus Limnocylindria bacterium]
MGPPLFLGSAPLRAILPILAALSGALVTQADATFDFTTSDAGWTGTTQWTWAAGGWSTPGIPSTIGTLTSPTLTVSADGFLTGSLNHAFAFDTSGGGPPPSGLIYYDGGQLQYSTDLGSSWNTVPGNLITGLTYGGLLTPGTGNPIEGQAAWVYSGPAGTSSFTLGTGSYPFETGTAAAFTTGQQVQLRLLGAWDPSSDSAWLVTSLSLTSVPEPTAYVGVTAACLGALVILRRNRSTR